MKELPSVTDTGTAESTVPSVGLGQTPLRCRFSGCRILACLWCHGASVRAPPRHRAVPKACPNEVARAVFWWLAVARKGRSGYTNGLTSPLCQL